MNKIIIIGNIGQDAQVRQAAANGNTPISFSVAVSEKRGQEEHTEWFSCTKWVQSGGSTAIANYLKRGTKVAVEGKVSTRAYTDRDGQTRASLEVNVQNIELLGGGQQQQQPAAPVAPASMPQPTPHSFHPTSNQKSDDLPF